jgi:cell division transport system permease protein
MRSLDLPLDQTAVSRFLPWIMAGLIYLSVFALALAAVADGALELVDQRSKQVTVTLPPNGDLAAEERETAAVLALLGRADGVISATPLGEEELQDLIEPWLGQQEQQSDLALPRIIDVTLDADATPDLNRLESELRNVAPEATIGIQAVARDNTERQASFFRAIGIVVGAILLLGSIAVVWIITGLSLAMHTDTVTLLRYMGANDGYLARQFERYALQSGLKGGVIGFFAAMLTVLALLYAAQTMELTNTIGLGLRPVDWVFLACVPVICAVVCTLMARMTALWGLGRMI